MQRYIAFLSGLPTGQHAVTQEALTSLFTKLGFAGVETHGTSGNVAFETAPVGVTGALEAQISRHLKRSIDANLWTFLRTPDELSKITAGMPFPEKAEDSSVFVVLLSEDLDREADRRIRAYHTSSDRLQPSGREIYWLRSLVSASSPPLALARILDSHGTVRSFSTIRALADKYGARSRTTAGGATASERFRR
jgi:uncharacterized protein (DUF1697 family)